MGFKILITPRSPPSLTVYSLTSLTSFHISLEGIFKNLYLVVDLILPELSGDALVRERFENILAWK